MQLATRLSAAAWAAALLGGLLILAERPPRLKRRTSIAGDAQCGRSDPGSGPARMPLR